MPRPRQECRWAYMSRLQWKRADSYKQIMISVKMKFNKLSGVGLVLSGILASHVLALCEVFFFDPSVVCSLSEHWCAGRSQEWSWRHTVFSIAIVIYIIRRICNSIRPSNSAVESAKKQAFEDEQERIKAKEAARQRKEAARLREEERRKSLCPQCQGSGMDQNGELCPRCHGRGMRQTTTCKVCEGKGVNAAGGLCPKCGGRGQYFED